MENQLPIEALRLKQLREALNYTQSGFAELLGIGTTTYDIERGKARLTGKAVAELVKLFNVNPLWLYGESEQKRLNGQTSGTIPKVVTVNPLGNENIVMVNQRASAGYPNNMGDTEWYSSLPVMDLPLPELRNSTYRAFQVKGDSMLPVFKSGQWVIAKAIEGLESIKTNRFYVVSTIDSLLLKQVNTTESPMVALISLNQEYQPLQVSANEIHELWEVTHFLGEVDTLKNVEIGMSLLEIKADLKEIKRSMR